MSDFNEDYSVKEQNHREKRHERIVDIIALIFCLIAAIGIWLFAVNKGKETPKNEGETKTETEAGIVVLPVDYIVK